MTEKKTRQFLAYLVTNRVTGHRYVGITCRGVARRWVVHQSDARLGRRHAMAAAIRKHGAAAFEVEAIACAKSYDDLLALEIQLIAQWGTKRPGGYNLTDGGQGSLGHRHSAEARRRIGAGGKGRIVSEATRKIMRAAKIGKPLDADHRKKLSLSKLGKKLPPRDPAHAAKISAGLIMAHARRKALQQ